MKQRLATQLSLALLLAATAAPLPVAANEEGASESNGGSSVGEIVGQGIDIFNAISSIISDARGFLNDLIPADGAALTEELLAIFPSLRTFGTGVNEILNEVTEKIPFLDGLQVSEETLGVPDISKLEDILAGRTQNTFDEVLLNLGFRENQLNPVTDVLEARTLSTVSRVAAEQLLNEQGQTETRESFEDFVGSVEDIVDSTQNTLNAVETGIGASTSYDRLQAMLEAQREAALQRQEESLNGLRDHAIEQKRLMLQANQTQLAAEQLESEAKRETRELRGAALGALARRQSYEGFVLPSGAGALDPGAPGDSTSPIVDSFVDRVEALNPSR